MKPGDKDSQGHYILTTRPSTAALQVARDNPNHGIKFGYIGLVFCPAAGAQAPFAVNRMNELGEVNAISVWYYDTLIQAIAHYLEQR